MSMTEAIRWLSAPEVPTAASIRKSIINKPIVMGLVSAYDGARALEAEEEEGDAS